MKEFFLCAVVVIFAMSCRANPVEMEFPKFSKKVTEQAQEDKSKGCSESYDQLRQEGEKSCTIVKFNEDKKKEKTNRPKGLAKDKSALEVTQ